MTAELVLGTEARYASFGVDATSSNCRPQGSYGFSHRERWSGYSWHRWGAW